MRLFLIPLTLALVLACAVPDSVPAGPDPVQKPFAPPRLRIDPGGRVDLGELGPLETRTQSYTVTNTSAAAITLRLLDLAPGVSVAGPALEHPIPPMASKLLVLRVDPADSVGPQARNVRLGTDDPGQGSYFLPIRMKVRPDLTVDGERRTFGDVGFRESPEAVFSFARETGKPLAVRIVTGLPPHLEGEVRAEGAGAQVAFTLRPGRIPPGMRLGLERVRVETNAPLQPSFDLYLEWRLHHAIEAAPQRVVFADPEPDTLVVRLKARNGVPFRILGARLEGEGFQLGPLSRSSAPGQTLSVRRTTTVPSRAMLVLECSGEEDPLRIPIAYLPALPSRDEDVIVVPNKTD
jgi:hypothetical protein